MDILPKILGEKEFKHFTKSDYAALSSVLDDVTARYLQDYCANPNADKEVVTAIEENLSGSITSLTFHLELKKRGLIDLVQGLAPESLVYADVNLDELIEKLSYLEEHQGDIKSTIPGRCKDDFRRFEAAVSGVISRIYASGSTPTYPDIMERLSANKFLFYQTGEKEHTTGVGILNSKKRQWTLALNGAKWLKYCNERNLTHDMRSVF